MDYCHVFCMLLSSFFVPISISLHFWLLNQCDVSFKVHRVVGSQQHVMHAGYIMQNVAKCSETLSLVLQTLEMLFLILAY